MLANLFRLDRVGTVREPDKAGCSRAGAVREAAPTGRGRILHLHSESLITHGRNVIVLKFLSDESFTHLFWIDSDIAFPSEAAFRLLRADRDIAAGVYPMKRFNWLP